MSIVRGLFGPSAAEQVEALRAKLGIERKRGADLVPGRVVHCKRERYDVYVGRPGMFGNPFAISDSCTREQSIERFERYARAKIEESPSFRDAVKGLYGKQLGCWCAPQPCHGEVLLKLAAELHNSSRQERPEGPV